MYANNIIKGCSEILQMAPSKMGWMADVLGKLMLAQKIYMGNVRDVWMATGMEKRIGECIFTRESPYVRPPFGITLYMYDVDWAKGGNKGQRAILIEDVDGDGAELKMHTFVNVKYENYAGWACYPMRARIVNRMDIDYFDEQGGGPLDLIWYEEAMSVMGRERSEEEFRSIMQRAMSLAYMAMLLMSCKNITTQDVVAPEKQQKARRKKGKGPIYTYKVLSVLCPSNVRKINKGEAPTNTGTQRLHICRGHFKEYTADAPLFGRVVGRYWWQPMMRGKAENGIVNKDYNIKTK